MYYIFYKCNISLKFYYILINIIYFYKFIIFLQYKYYTLYKYFFKKFIIDGVLHMLIL